jgi:peptide/nickel transport system substrate-binding protein
MTRRVSRRRFIGGAAGASFLAAGGASWAALVARDSYTETAATDVEPTAPPASQPSPAATPVVPRGGRQVIASPSAFSIDTFDAQLTGESSVVEILGRTHSRLVQWTDVEQPLIGADLASSWEMPDATTTIFRIDPNAKWHDRPPINGRPVTAEDVVAHFQRSLEMAAGGKAPLAQRYHTYSTIESVDSPGEGLVQFRTKRPDPFLLDTLASEFALIQAPEAVREFAGSWSKADSDHVIGSGPWTFDWGDAGVKFTAFRHGHRQPSLDELHVSEPHDVAERFIDGHLDETIIRDRRDAERLRAKSGTASPPPIEYRRFEREIVMSSFFIGAPPWNNVELVNAISYALARSELVGKLFGGRAWHVRGTPLALWGRKAAETLDGWPGAIPGPDGHYSGARQLWEAAGGPGLGTVTIDFPSVFDPLYSASSIVIDQLNRVLGPQFRPAVETYTTISKRVLEGYYGNGRAAFWFGWGPPIATRQPERYFAELYVPGSSGQRAVGGAGMQPGTGDLARMGHLGIVPWVHQFAEVYRRPNHAGPEPSPFWNQHLDYLRSKA